MRLELKTVTLVRLICRISMQQILTELLRIATHQFWNCWRCRWRWRWRLRGGTHVKAASLVGLIGVSQEIPVGVVVPIAAATARASTRRHGRGRTFGEEEGGRCEGWCRGFFDAECRNLFGAD
jgi:hypothetical protein